MLYNNIKFDNKCIFYMSTCCTSFENLGMGINTKMFILKKLDIRPVSSNNLLLKIIIFFVFLICLLL